MPQKSFIAQTQYKKLTGTSGSALIHFDTLKLNSVTVKRNGYMKWSDENRQKITLNVAEIGREYLNLKNECNCEITKNRQVKSK